MNTSLLFTTNTTNKFSLEVLLFELFFQNSSYVSGVSVCIFVALYVRMSVAGANKVEGIMS